MASQNKVYISKGKTRGQCSSDLVRSLCLARSVSVWVAAKNNTETDSSSIMSWKAAGTMVTLLCGGGLDVGPLDDRALWGKFAGGRMRCSLGTQEPCHAWQWSYVRELYGCGTVKVQGMAVRSMTVERYEEDAATTGERKAESQRKKKNIRAKTGPKRNSRASLRGPVRWPLAGRFDFKAQHSLKNK